MITVVLPYSRSKQARTIKACLRNLIKPDDTELLVVIDGPKTLERSAYTQFSNIGFAKVNFVVFGTEPAEGIDNRRYRISAIHNKAKHFISPKSDKVFLVEDDTTFAPYALDSLMDVFKSEPTCRFAEGVELGRHNVAYIGAWQVDHLLHPTVVQSVMPVSGVPYTAIDGGGLYCCLVDADLYRNHHFEPLDKVGNNGLSCDLNFGLSIRRKGYECYIDWRVLCNHLTDTTGISLHNTNPQLVQFDKDPNGSWFGRVAG